MSTTDRPDRQFAGKIGECRRPRSRRPLLDARASQSRGGAAGTAVLVLAAMSLSRFVSLYRDAARVGRRDKEPQVTRYLISFDAHSMDHIPDEDMPAVGRAAHEVVDEAMNAGVWVFGGGLEHQKASVVGTDGTVSEGSYPEAVGGLWVVDAASRDEALEWAAKTAVACRCAQEVREFMPDPAVGN